MSILADAVFHVVKCVSTENIISSILSSHWGLHGKKPNAITDLMEMIHPTALYLKICFTLFAENFTYMQLLVLVIWLDVLEKLTSFI